VHGDPYDHFFPKELTGLITRKIPLSKMYSIRTDSQGYVHVVVDDKQTFTADGSKGRGVFEELIGGEPFFLYWMAVTPAFTAFLTSLIVPFLLRLSSVIK
jgi:hypothetical protein